MRSGDVPVAIARSVVEVDIERTVIRSVVRVTANKREAAPQVPVYKILLSQFNKVRNTYVANP